MDETWDDEPQINTGMDGGNNFAKEGGKSFNRGRGFSSNSKPLRSPNRGSKDRSEKWNKESNHKESRWDDNNGDSEDNPRGRTYDRGNRGGRGGRGGGGRGRGGGRFDGNRNDGENRYDGNRNEGNDFDGNRNEGRRGGFRGNDRNDEDGRSSSRGRDSRRGKENFGGRGGGGRGGRGGRGGSREGRSEERDAPDSTSDQPQKPREVYIPPEPTNDENELFNTGISCGINFGKFDDIKVEVTGDNIPPSVATFEEAGLRPLLLNNIKRSNYTRPTPIQKNALPVIMAGRDLMGCAQTGSGKTAAFLLPIINSLLENPTPLVVDMEHAEPQVLIVSPTRELAIQIFEEARKFSYDAGLKTVLAYGGTSVGYQRKHVANGCHILVCTPGRMGDFAKRGLITFSSIRFVVLDEADRMLDMGFLSTMEEVLLNDPTMPPAGQRRTLMFSATFPELIQKLAAQFLRDYIFVTVGIIGSASSDVEQVIHKVNKFNKRSKLLEVLKEGNAIDGTLIFVETKRNADFIATYLSENDFKTTSIHGDRLQREREEALRDFKGGSRHVLVATSVAARGLDIKNVKHVINYDLPKSIDDYVHRIGRTGRVGNSGKATSFYDEAADSALASELAKILKQANQPVPSWLLSFGGLEDFESSATFGGCDMRGDVGQSKSVEVVEEFW